MERGDPPRIGAGRRPSTVTPSIVGQAEIGHHWSMRDFDALSVGDTTARAYLRIPDGARSGVVVLHAWWGLNDDVLDYADRLVDAG